jgi:hypothetical protein
VDSIQAGHFHVYDDNAECLALDCVASGKAVLLGNDINALGLQKIDDFAALQGVVVNDKNRARMALFGNAAGNEIMRIGHNERALQAYLSQANSGGVSHKRATAFNLDAAHANIFMRNAQVL